MPGIINPSVLAATRVAVDMRVRAAYAAVPKDLLWYNQIATVIDSAGKTGITYYLDQMVPRLRKWVGSRHVLGLKRIAETMLNEEYERTIGIPIPDIETDNLGVYQAAQDQLGRVAALWPNDLVEAGFVAGVTTTWLDGQPFFNGSHPLELADGALSTTQSNLHTGMALTAANFGTVRARMRLLKGEDNKVLGVGNGQLLCVVPQALEDTANKIFGADQAGYLYNASSTASDSNPYKNAAKVLVLPDLDAHSSTTWGLFDPNGPIKPFLVQIRKYPNRVVSVDKPTDQPVFENNMAYFGVNGSGACAFGLWQLAHLCTA